MDEPSPTPEARRRMRRALLRWYNRYRRDLPWRRDRDPYRIWVSEVMLQQTQVATVIPYFERFLAAFPNVAALAAAPEQEVLRLWEGLGYYRRARALHRAARHLCTHFDGQLPADPEVWKDLPGIGRYTLGAILSQAFGLRLPIVEANSERVLCRLFGHRDDPRAGPGRRWLWRVAEEMLPGDEPGEFNQALMELGALVCVSGAPRCDACPLAGDCVARKTGAQAAIPLKAAAPDPVDVREAAVVISRKDKVLLVQRPDSGRWAGMWEFPHGELRDGEAHEAAAVRLAAELTGLKVNLGPELTTVRHGVTHHRITMVCFSARSQRGRFRSSFYARAEWLTPEQLTPYPVSSPQRRLAQTLVQEGIQRRLF